MVRTDERSRPRVEGDREREILDAALETCWPTWVRPPELRRRGQRGEGLEGHSLPSLAGEGRPGLDALQLIRRRGLTAPPFDTGSLRGDLIAQACAARAGSARTSRVQVFAGLVRYCPASPSSREAIMHPSSWCPRWRSPSRPSARPARAGRSAGADLEMLATSLPAICIHGLCCTGTNPSQERLISPLVDSVVLPACRRDPAARLTTRSAASAAAPSPRHREVT